MKTHNLFLLKSEGGTIGYDMSIKYNPANINSADMVKRVWIEHPVTAHEAELVAKAIREGMKSLKDAHPHDLNYLDDIAETYEEAHETKF